ncbi:MAG: poly-gamma-glutamate system protein [Candidatus Cloacimonetes bacterium]|nr:poly-gamma-glutamate system protein [Candidatus Cloacimonadota bacterium]
MFKPSLKSTWTLFLLAAVSYGLYLWAWNSRVDHRQIRYQEKLAAARLMDRALHALKEHQAPNGVLVDDINDPWNTLLIGQKFTQITSLEGDLRSKQSSLNPNVAALVVQLMVEAGVKENDRVAVCLTGDFPGINIAVYAACQVLKLEPVVITSVSSSWFGANDPDFTWLDMETVLRDRGVFPWTSRYASVGGADDRGESLSPEGRELIRAAIKRNKCEYLNPANLQKAVDLRIQAFQQEVSDSPRGYDLFVNVGEGVASLGHMDNAALLPSGVAHNVRLMDFPDRGVLHFFADGGVPVINLVKLSLLMREYGLPLSPDELPEIGEGSIFVTERHNLKVVLVSTLLLTVLVLFVIRTDLRSQKLREPDLGSDEIL